MSNTTARPAPVDNLELTTGELTTFLDNNPLAGLRRDGANLYITKPWGDASLELKVSSKNGRLARALNDVYLPPRLSAIWHYDRKELELIYGFEPIDADTHNRSFEFQYCNRAVRCRFDAPSSVLMDIARASRPSGETTRTDYRKVGIPYGSNPETCPVRMLQAWREQAAITTGPLFRAVNRHGQVQQLRLSDLTVRAGDQEARGARGTRYGQVTRAIRSGQGTLRQQQWRAHRSGRL